LPHQGFPAFVIPFIYNAQEDIECAWQRKISNKMPYWEKHWLVYGKDYSVNPLTEQDTGGILTMLNPLPAGAQQLVIRRVTPKTQAVDLNDNMKLRAELIESIGDKVTMAIQEISQQYINKDNIEEIKDEINKTIETAQKEIEILLARQIEHEAAVRQAADDYEAAARQAGDSALRIWIEKVAVQADENRFAFNSLLQIILAKFGPLVSITLITESRDILVTEAGTRLVA
jgi:hypothetical protein